MQNELENKAYGKTSPLGLLCLLIVTAVAGSGLSILYLYLVSIIPNVKLTILVTLVFGGILGAIGAFICRIFKIKGRVLPIVVSIIAILIYTYFKWATYCSYIYEDSFFAILPSLLMDPADLKERIIEINKYGTWSLGANSDPVNGIRLTIVWIIEFVIYAGLHLLIVNNVNDEPAAEKNSEPAVEAKTEE